MYILTITFRVLMPGVVDQQGVLVAYSKYTDFTSYSSCRNSTSDKCFCYCYQRETYILPRCFTSYSLHRDHAGCWDVFIEWWITTSPEKSIPYYEKEIKGGGGVGEIKRGSFVTYYLYKRRAPLFFCYRLNRERSERNNQLATVRYS